MVVRTDKLASVKLLTECNFGTEPIYGKGTGKGEATCPTCMRNVLNVIYFKQTRQFTGKFKTICDCGTQINYANAEQYI